MKSYWKNLKYIFEHKRNVFIEGRKLGLGPIQLLMHDMSKFSLFEFPQYAASFFGSGRNEVVGRDFSYAWLHHKHKNKHHWQYWLDISNHEIIPLKMPTKYMLEMLADWNAMSRKFHPDVNTVEATRTWYEDQKDIILHPYTKANVEQYFKIELESNNR